MNQMQIFSQVVPAQFKSSCFVPSSRFEEPKQPATKQMVIGELFQVHSLNMDFRKDQKNQLNSKVLMFIAKFLQKGQLYNSIRHFVNKYKREEDIDNHINVDQNTASFQTIQESNMCQQDKTSKPATPIAQKQKNQVGGGRRFSKKVSIFVEEEMFNDTDESSKDDITTNFTVKTLHSLEISQTQMSMQTLSLIFDTPAPFLINLAVCLFVRYCFQSKEASSLDKSVWILVVSTVIAYKMYYDQSLQGLMDYFAQILHTDKKRLINLQRCFCEQIGYNTVIGNHEYHFILYQLISMPIELEHSQIK